MELRIYSLDGTVFEGEVSSVSLPTVDGEITVLKDHIPLITTLKEGLVRWSGDSKHIKGGFVEVGNNRVVVLVS